MTEEMIAAGRAVASGVDDTAFERIYLAMRSKDHSIAVDDVRLDQGEIAEIIAHSMGRYPTDDPVLDATMAVIAYVNGPRLRTLSTGGKK